VTNGHQEGSKQIEIIDLEDPEKVCQPVGLADFPIDLYGGSGGILNHNMTTLMTVLPSLTMPPKPQ
jgi:hypothetical protein